MLDIVKCELILCRLFLKNVWRLRNIYKTNQPKFCCIPRPQSPDIRCFFFYLVHTTGALYDAAECVFFFFLSLITLVMHECPSAKKKKSRQRRTHKQNSLSRYLSLIMCFFFFLGRPLKRSQFSFVVII